MCGGSQFVKIHLQLKMMCDFSDMCVALVATGFSVNAIEPTFLGDMLGIRHFDANPSAQILVLFYASSNPL